MSQFHIPWTVLLREGHNSQGGHVLKLLTVGFCVILQYFEPVPESILPRDLDSGVFIEVEFILSVNSVNVVLDGL